MRRRPVLRRGKHGVGPGADTHAVNAFKRPQRFADLLIKIFDALHARLELCGGSRRSRVRENKIHVFKRRTNVRRMAESHGDAEPRDEIFL